MPDMPYRVRQQKLVESVQADGLDAVLVSSTGTLRWLCGFNGSNGALLVARDGSWFFTDGRYENEAHDLVLSGTVSDVGMVIHGLPAALAAQPVFAGALARMAGEGARAVHLAVEADHLTVAGHDALLESLSEHACDYCDVCPRTGLANALRAVKDEVELETMTRALRLTESVFLDVLSLVREGVSERELAAEIDYRQKRAGASRSSFETIVAFGSHTARPHARPGPRRLAPATPILFDFGCELDGYCSDMTRMACIGEPPPGFREVWGVVDSARTAAVEAVSAGVSSQALDRVARRVIEGAGYGDQFSHALGHGLGIEVHEWPGVSKRADHTLRDQMVITIEPGIYLENRFGIRLEDTVVISPAGSKRLNRLSTETVLL